MKADRTNEIIDDRYKIITQLGTGGMAIVYKAHDLISDKDVALKTLRPEMAIEKVNLTRFEREARAAASLNHPNIVKVINVGTFDGYPYMVNEFVEGQTLKQVLDVRGKFSFIEACHIMYQLCSAVKYAHQHGVIHRDIKPQNIFLTKDASIKLGDFGIATFAGGNNQITKEGVFTGTPNYIPPELITGLPVTTRSDIYSVGITFFELITGTLPFDGYDINQIAYMHISAKFPSLKKYNPKTPDCIANIIYKACKKDPMQRYGDAGEMRNDIEKILRNPSLLEKKAGFLYSLFHPNSAEREARKVARSQKKALKQASKAAKNRNE